MSQREGSNAPPPHLLIRSLPPRPYARRSTPATTARQLLPESSKSLASRRWRLRLRQQQTNATTAMRGIKMAALTIVAVAAAFPPPPPPSPPADPSRGRGYWRARAGGGNSATIVKRGGLAVTSTGMTRPKRRVVRKDGSPTTYIQ